MSNDVTGQQKEVSYSDASKIACDILAAKADVNAQQKEADDLYDYFDDFNDKVSQKEVDNSIKNIGEQTPTLQKDPEDEDIFNILDGSSAVLGQQPTTAERFKKIEKEIEEMLTGLSAGDDSSEEAKTPTRFATLKRFVFKSFVISSAFTAILGLVTFLQHRYPAFTAKYYPSLMTQFTTTQLAPLFASLEKRLSQPMLVIKRFMKA